MALYHISGKFLSSIYSNSNTRIHHVYSQSDLFLQLSTECAKCFQLVSFHSLKERDTKVAHWRRWQRGSRKGKVLDKQTISCSRIHFPRRLCALCYRQALVHI